MANIIPIQRPRSRRAAQRPTAPTGLPQIPRPSGPDGPSPRDYPLPIQQPGIDTLKRNRPGTTTIRGGTGTRGGTASPVPHYQVGTAEQPSRVRPGMLPSRNPDAKYGILRDIMKNYGVEMEEDAGLFDRRLGGAWNSASTAGDYGNVMYQLLEGGEGGNRVSPLALGNQYLRALKKAQMGAAGVRGLAKGGTVKDDETVVVGEEWPELVTKEEDGTVRVTPMVGEEEEEAAMLAAEQLGVKTPKAPSIYGDNLATPSYPVPPRSRDISPGVSRLGTGRVAQKMASQGRGMSEGVKDAVARGREMVRMTLMGRQMLKPGPKTPSHDKWFSAMEEDLERAEAAVARNQALEEQGAEIMGQRGPALEEGKEAAGQWYDENQVAIDNAVSQGQEIIAAAREAAGGWPGRVGAAADKTSRAVKGAVKEATGKAWDYAREVTGEAEKAGEDILGKAYERYEETVERAKELRGVDFEQLRDMSAQLTSTMVAGAKEKYTQEIQQTMNDMGVQNVSQLPPAVRATLQHGRNLEVAGIQTAMAKEYQSQAVSLGAKHSEMELGVRVDLSKALGEMETAVASLESDVAVAVGGQALGVEAAGLQAITSTEQGALEARSWAEQKASDLDASLSKASAAISENGARMSIMNNNARAQMLLQYDSLLDDQKEGLADYLMDMSSEWVATSPIFAAQLDYLVKEQIRQESMKVGSPMVG